MALIVKVCWRLAWQLQRRFWHPVLQERWQVRGYVVGRQASWLRYLLEKRKQKVKAWVYRRLVWRQETRTWNFFLQKRRPLRWLLGQRNATRRRQDDLREWKHLWRVMARVQKKRLRRDDKAQWRSLWRPLGKWSTRRPGLLLLSRQEQALRWGMGCRLTQKRCIHRGWRWKRGKTPWKTSLYG